MAAKHEEIARLKARLNHANALTRKEIGLKNTARQEKRNLLKRLQRLKRVRVIKAECKARIERAEAEVEIVEDREERLASEITRLKGTVLSLEAKIDFARLAVPLTGISFERLSGGAIPAPFESSPSKQRLLEALGKKRESYTQDIIELGLTLMGLELSAEQAVEVVRAFVTLEYPEKKEGIHFRIPDARRFREWRQYIEPLCHYVAVSLISVAKRSHVMHDASSKRLVHIYHTGHECEIISPEGDVVVVYVPLRFSVLASGKAEDEAAQSKSDLSSDLGGGIRASMINVVSATSDNAARATSEQYAKLKEEERVEVEKIVNEHIEQYPEELASAVAAYCALTEQQREESRILHELSCTGHGLNLTVDESWKHSEAAALACTMAHDRAARIIQRNGFASGILTNRYMSKGYVGDFKKFLDARFAPKEQRARNAAKAAARSSNKAPEISLPTVLPIGRHMDGVSPFPDPQDFLRSASKLLAAEGTDAEYYLNEKRQFEAFCRKSGLPYTAIITFLGHRQSVNVRSASCLLRNKGNILKYLSSVRAEGDPNMLVVKVFAGIRDRFILAACSSRSLVDTVFNAPMVFFTHSNYVGREHIRGIMDCAQEYVEQEFGELSYVGCLTGSRMVDGRLEFFESSKKPSLQGLSKAILAKFPHLQAP